ncbi:MAG: DUF503 domain-containing protein [Candidatus Hydrogenedentota bacterium]
MTIGVLHMEIGIPGAHSLKEKRRATKSLKTKLGNRYNCSVAEEGHHDLWNRAQFAVCVISDDHGHLSAQLDEIVRFSSTHHLVELIDYSIETF